MKIAIARLRSGTNYTEPLNHIIDSFCEGLKYFIKQHPEHDFLYYNFAFGRKPNRDLEAIKNSDVIIIPSESEFTYHIPGAIHTLDVKRSNTHVEELIPFIQGKTLIILRSDRQDNEQLYRKVFPGKWTYKEIDEIDFPNNIHSLKYYFIKELPKLFDAQEKTIDFCYWGSDKRRGPGGKLSGDQRHVVLKEIYKNPAIKSYFIGRFHGFQRDEKIGKMKSILPVLSSSKATLCFNWLDSRATTSRYIEAISSGMIPFVWGDYDSSGIFVKDPWQRVYSRLEFIDKMREIENNGTFYEKFQEIENSFLSGLLPKQEYLNLFEEKLLCELK